MLLNASKACCMFGEIQGLAVPLVILHQMNLSVPNIENKSNLNFWSCYSLLNSSSFAYASEMAKIRQRDSASAATLSLPDKY